MLHGFTGSPVSMGRLSSPAGAAPSLGGHLDEPPSADFWSEVDRLAALVPEATRLFGYSLGGRLVLGLLARFPQRFAHAVVVSAHPGLRSEAERAVRRTQDERWICLLRRHGVKDFVAAWERQPLWHTQRRLPAAILAARRRERLGHTASGLAGSLQSVGLGQMPDLRPALTKTDCVVDLLVGGEDPAYVALATELCKVLPHGRLHVAKNAGHDLLMERPDFCSAHLEQGIPICT
jgi:2-succinyl-6-hydroxy-2,4-cyclohexadiene-1-carboxylate synthase